MNKPLAIWPYPPAPEALSAIKQAKADLALDYTVTPVEAVPGGPVRVLSVGVLPPFLCDVAKISDLNRPEAVRAALEYALGENDGGGRAFEIVDYLSAIFGSEVKEVFDGQDGTGNDQARESRVAFR